MKCLLARKWIVMGCLGLLLVGGPLLLSACTDVGDGSDSPTYTPNGSLQYPYPLTVSKGACTAWKIVFANSGGDPLCASTLPTQQVGKYVQLSYGSVTQKVCIVSLDARRQVADVL